MQVQNYNLDAPIPTSCVPWGSRNPTATEVRLRIDDLLGHIKDQAQHKKEKNMCYNTLKTVSIKSTGAVASIQAEADRSDENKRQHLLEQLRQTKWTKRDQAEKFFNLSVDSSPKNFRELLAAIKDGKFTIDEKRAAKIDAKILNGEPTYTGAFDGIIWDGPQKDLKGYDKFFAYLEDEYQKAKDEIIVLSLEKGLEALRRFQDLEVAAKA